jgi:hypothetical protein
MRRLRRAARVVSLSVLLSMLTLAGSLSPPSVAALSGSSFDPARIINDYVFTNKEALSVGQIQSFLETKNSGCDTDGSEGSPYSGGTNAQYGTSRGYPPPYVCLENYRENPTIPTGSGEPWWDKGRTNLQGATVNPSGDRSAAQIISDAAHEHRISPKVLLVMLQKETSLITDISPWPSQYRKAMGFACPDTAACNPAYRGFYNQVSSAARQLRRYLDYPENYNHTVGNTFVRYHPNSSCGGTVVNIRTASTAALYNYTPYQPNKAALDNLYGTGNACSAYGNRNFWRLYNDWFGSTLTPPPPDKALVGDWDDDGRAEIGLKRGNEYLLDYNNDGVSNKTFGWGRASDVALVGDWDGDGMDETGLKRGDQYYLDTDNDGDSDIRFGMGRATDVALVGDWDGDGDETIGLRRGKEYFYDNNHDGDADVAFGIGRATDVALVGDWDGDGDDTIGLRRASGYYLDNNNDRNVEVSFDLGKASDGVLVGDWDGDNKDEIGLKRNNRYFYDNNNDGDADASFIFGYF